MSAEGDTRWRQHWNSEDCIGCCTETQPLIPRFTYHPELARRQYADTLFESSTTRYDYEMTKFKKSRTWTVIIVAFALFLDYTLLTAIVPIMPQFLREQNAKTTFMDKNVGTNNATEAKSTISPSNESNGVSFLNDDLRSKHASPPAVETKTRSKTGSDIFWFLGYTDESTNSVQENTELGLMFASKPFVQLITIPIIGLAMSKICMHIILVGGFLILSISSLFFGLGTSFTTLLFARAVQGIGSSCCNLAGMTLVAEIFQDSDERMRAMARAITGIALGTLFGPVYGGIMYEFFGKTMPFLILALLGLAGVGLHSFVLWPTTEPKAIPFKSLKSVVWDPYTFLVCVAITIPNMALTFLESALPSWMLRTMNATAWQQGVIFVPDCICYLICSYYIGSIGVRFDRWSMSMTGFILLGLSFVLIPLSSAFLQTAVPMLILGFSLGLTDGTLLTELGTLADIRHAAIYGAVYALEEIVVCVGYMIGPIFSAIFISCYGFEKTCFSIAVICFGFAPLMYFLKYAY